MLFKVNAQVFVSHELCLEDVLDCHIFCFILAAMTTRIQ